MPSLVPKDKNVCGGRGGEGFSVSRGVLDAGLYLGGNYMASWGCGTQLVGALLLGPLRMWAPGCLALMALDRFGTP